MKNYQLIYNISRYVVPFRINCSFEEACAAVQDYRITENGPVSPAVKSMIDLPDLGEKAEKRRADEKQVPLWEQDTADVDGLRTDSELYSYIRNEFKWESEDPAEEEDKEKKNENKDGLSWTCDLKMKNQSGIQISYFPGEYSPEEPGISIFLKKMGISLFRNGLGVFWYEVELGKEQKCIVDSEVIHGLQRQLSNFNGKPRFWIRRRFPGAKMNRLKQFWTLEDCKKNKGEDYYTAATPVFLEYWVAECLNCLSSRYQFLMEAKPGYPGTCARLLGKLKGAYGENTECPALYGKELIPEEAFREHTYVPKRSIPFSFFIFRGDDVEKTPEGMIDPAEQMRRKELVYHLNNTFSGNVRFSHEVAGEMRQPFENAIWYATTRGISYTSWAEDEKEEGSLRTTVARRFCTDYFTLLIKVMYQSYSLMFYGERISAEKTFSDLSSFSRDEQERVKNLYMEVNLFLTRSMATSVSFMPHHSDFYIYLKKQFRVHEDVKSVTSGLESIESLLRHENQDRVQKEQQEWEEREKESDNRMQAIMSIFALLGIASVFVDAYSFVWEITDSARWTEEHISRNCLEVGMLLIIIILSAYATRYCIKAIRETQEKKMSVWEIFRYIFSREKKNRKNNGKK